MSELSRREALQTIGALCCGALIPPILLSCAPTKQVTLIKEDANILTLSLEEFQEGVVVVQSKKFKYPIAVSRFEDGKFIALLMQCTHKGCELRSEGTYLVCPCHGSEFDSEGKVLTPPAEKSLHTFPVRTDQKYIYIDIS